MHNKLLIAFAIILLYASSIFAQNTYKLNALLEAGQIVEQVVVTAGAEAINASNAELSMTIGREQIRELPLNGRNPLALISLTPGAGPTTTSINGQRSSSTTITRDGLNVQDNFIRTGGGQRSIVHDQTVKCSRGLGRGRSNLRRNIFK